MKNIVFVMNIPSPYRLHTFRYMWKECQQRGIGFHVHFMARGHKERPKSWLNPKIDFPHTYWKDYGFKSHHWNPGLVRELLKNPPEWIHLGSPFDTFTCIALALLNKKSILCAGCEGNTKTPGKMDGFLGWFKRLIYSKCPYVTVPGSDGAGYIALHQQRTKKKMPVPILLPNLVDETRFKPRAEWPREDISAMREFLHVGDDEKLALIPARLESDKGLLPLIAQLDAALLRGWKIVIMGQGSLKNEILTAIRARGLDREITVLDYVPYEKMPIFYAAADLLLLPSVHDPNPLSVIEALHTGLPLALSNMTGNVNEAVTDGKNGWVLPVRDTSTYRETLQQVFGASIEKLREMGRYSYAHNAAFWRTESTLEHYINSVEKAGDDTMVLR